MNNKLKSIDEGGFFVVVFVLGLLNVFGTQSTIISLLASIIEYYIVIIFLVKKQYKKSFTYYLAFLAITLENDIFTYGDLQTASQHVRYSFFNLPIIHSYLQILLGLIFIYMAYIEYKAYKLQFPKQFLKLMKLLMILLCTGVITIIIAMVVNDNGIMNWPYYPKRAILEILSCLGKVGTIFTALVVIQDDEWRNTLAHCLLLSIVVVALVSGLTALFGIHGFYGEDYIMLSSLAIAYTPLLIVFYNSDTPKIYQIVALASGLFVIITSFKLPTCIGSKWYMIIIAGVAGWLIIKAKIKSVWSIILIALLSLFAITLVSDPLIELISGGNEFIEWKLSQALETINFFGTNSAQDWYEDMNNSPLYRFDELHNTFIEYSLKPYYSIFGKGLGGTIRHHTNLLFWESGYGTFSEEQIKMGAYYTMHETLAVVFLQHGLIGVVFFIYLIGQLLKRLFISPWAMIGLIWIVFYWSYGTALSIGAVAMLLALWEDVDNKLKVQTKTVI